MPSSSSSSSLPPTPPPIRRREKQPSSSAQTLYATSPHFSTDKGSAKERLQRQRLASSYTDPFHVVIFILLLSLFFFLFPTRLPFGLSGVSSSSNKQSTASLLHHRLSKGLDWKDCSSYCDSLSNRKAMPWQKTFTLPSRGKGIHLVTPEIEREIADGLKGVKIGILTLFIQHTSAGLTINENFDPTVRKDMDMCLDKIVPESLPWQHVDEGPDDSASHTKCSLFGTSVTVPITDGRLNLGTWQGVMLAEMRRAKHSRRIVATILP